MWTSMRAEIHHGGAGSIRIAVWQRRTRIGERHPTIEQALEQWRRHPPADPCSAAPPALTPGAELGQNPENSLVSQAPTLVPSQRIGVEEEGDEIFTPIDCCTRFECQTWQGQQLVRPKLVQVSRYGLFCWTCPKCGGSYGSAATAGGA